MDSAELLLDDALVFLNWLCDENLPEYIQESLQQADAKLRAKEYDAAHDLCRQAINQVASKSLNEMIYASAGHARVHLGAVSYAQGGGHLDDAVDDFTAASKELSSSHRAQAVAEFALGATYALKGEQTKVHEHITPEVLDTLKWYPPAQGVDKKWEEIRSRMTPYHEIPQPAPAPTVDQAPPPLPEITDPPRPEPQIPSEGKQPLLHSVIILAALVAIFVGGALVVYTLSRNILGPLAYLVVLPTATLLSLNGLKCKVQQDQALVIETGGAPRVLWGPHTYYRLPFNEQFCALVSLSPLPYLAPPQSIKLTPEKSVTIRLQVYYRVDADGGNMQHVIESVYRPQLAVRGTNNLQQPKRSSGPCAPGELKRVWEQRLLQDIIATLSRVMPGVTYEKLAGNPVCDRAKILDRLKESLSQRVKGWGMIIEEVSIIDVAQNKS